MQTATSSQWKRWALRRSPRVAFAIALTATILARRARYYDALEDANKANEITSWLTWFAGTTIEAQRRTHALIEFLIDKTRLFDRLGAEINERQKLSAESRIVRRVGETAT
jgi:Fic family protein